MQALQQSRALAFAGKVPRVAVIGAGFAGLRCADVLARAGVQVTLFEARNRIGGRVHQVGCGGHVVDLGANWIHGTEGNPIMHLAEKTGTAVVELEGQQALFDTEGARRPDGEALEVASKVWEMVVLAFKYSAEHSASIDPQLGLLEYFRSELVKDTTVAAGRRADLLHEAQMWGPYVGDVAEKQSLRFFFLEDGVDSSNVFVAGTYKDILAEVGRTATESAKVDLRLETEIVHVDYGDAHQTPTITLNTATGEQASFDQVVVTCPLGWLKRNHATAFRPPLPSRLQAAISHINYGRLEKLYVTFPSAFWHPSSAGGDHWAGASNADEGPEYPLFTHFHDPSYVPHPRDEPWNQSVVSLAGLPPGTSQPTLLFYLYGPCGTHVVDSVAHLAAHSAEYNRVLDAFAAPFYSRLPNYAAGSPACTPTAFLVTTWQTDRLAGNGSYCNFQVGLERGDEDVEVLRDAGGLAGRGLWLAGEHTAPFIALGTTTGAWWSGEAVAKRICEGYGIEVPPEDADLRV